MHLPAAGFKTAPQDFVVDEVPAYLPSGAGDHVFVRFTKTGLTTDEAVQRIAGALGSPLRDAGTAGIKDKHAVTSQWASFFLPRAEPEPLLERLADDPSLRIDQVSRHGNKLKPGHLVGNAFRVRLRRLESSPPALAEALAEALGRAAAEGVPNAFGEQRFGHGGKNAEFARRVLSGEVPPPRDKKRARFLFSSLQSELFNHLVDRRIADGTWGVVLPGDIAKKEENGALFDVPLDEGEELEDARARARALAICATGPMFGASMREARGEVAKLEAEVLASAGLPEDVWTRHRHLGEGTRRALRLLAKDVSWRAVDDGDVEVAFVLGKGAYATTFLASMCELREPSRASPRTDAPSGGAAGASEPETDHGDAG